MVVVRLKKAWRGLGDWAESPSSDVLDRTAYARYGSAASANMFCRALSNNSYEGWSRDSRMISLLACRITRPGRAISAKRTALSRLLTHCPPNTRRFIAELKLNASTAMAHHAALAPNSLDGSLPPARSTDHPLGAPPHFASPPALALGNPVQSRLGPAASHSVPGLTASLQLTQRPRNLAPPRSRESPAAYPLAFPRIATPA